MATLPRPEWSPGYRQLPPRFARIVVAGVVVAAVSSSAFAYRPFDGTDAAVAKLGDVEIEYAPLDLLRDHSLSTIIAPFTIVNFGIAENWEAVFSGQADYPQAPSTDPYAITGVSAFLKYVVRPGVLQDKSGPSVAVEFGPLLPGFRADQSYGADLAVIVSQRWDWGTINWNAQTQYTRDHHADAFLSAIIEGPDKWKVRPVAEFYYEEEIGVARTMSALVGAIWQVNEELSFDFAVRHAVVSEIGIPGLRPVEEIRAGFTVGFPMSFFTANRRMGS
jgi:hypothetical protein